MKSIHAPFPVLFALSNGNVDLSGLLGVANRIIIMECEVQGNSGQMQCLDFGRQCDLSLPIRSTPQLIG